MAICQHSFLKSVEEILSLFLLSLSHVVCLIGNQTWFDSGSSVT